MKRICKERGNLDVQSCDKSKINDTLLHSAKFYLTDVYEYPRYDKIISVKEYNMCLDTTWERLQELLKASWCVTNAIHFMKLSDEEIQVLKAFRQFIYQMDEDLDFDESCVQMDDYFSYKDILDKITSSNM